MQLLELHFTTLDTGHYLYINDISLYSILDEDVGEEEFCDDQLEAYFEHLVLSEVEDMEEQELAEYFKPMIMPSLQVTFIQSLW